MTEEGVQGFRNKVCEIECQSNNLSRSLYPSLTKIVDTDIV